MEREIGLNDIPESMIVRAIRKRDILKIRILTRSEKKKLGRNFGTADVVAVSPLGYKIMLTREQLVKNFAYINGSRIRILGVRSGQSYVVYRLDDTVMSAMMVPKNTIINVGNRRVGEGRYIVSGTNSITNTPFIGVTNKENFRKMFIITEIDGGVVRDKKLKLNQQVKNKDMVENNISKQNNNKETREIKYKAIGKLLDSNNKIVGFIVVDSRGVRVTVDKAGMLDMCNRGLVVNIVSATRESDGKQYLRGNGIKIENLPTSFI